MPKDPVVAFGCHQATSATLKFHEAWPWLDSLHLQRESKEVVDASPTLWISPLQSVQAAVAFLLVLLLSSWYATILSLNQVLPSSCSYRTGEQ